MPAYLKTGGTELGHQLYAFLKKQSTIEVIMTYIGVKESFPPTPQEFECYVENWKRFEEIPDDENAIIILPEIYPDIILKFDYAKIVFWWMSVDNYLSRTSFIRFIRASADGTFHPSRFVCNILRATKRLLSGFFKRSRKAIYKASLHLYQSEYAREFLAAKGLNNILPLSDYINDAYLDGTHDCIGREDFVLYNPKKGYKFTRKLIKKNRSLVWKPLEKMTTVEVKHLLEKSKVYVDFGNHPGKDRFPREAAISGCCIITGRRGAAANDIDIEIPPKYKFNDSLKEEREISETIQDCLTNYEVRVKDFEGYRNKIRGEKELFFLEANKVLETLQNL